MSQFIELSDYDATIFRDILDTLVREDETLVEICEDRAIEEMRCYRNPNVSAPDKQITKISA